MDPISSEITIKEEPILKPEPPELQAEHFPFKWTPDGFRCPSCPFKTKIDGFLLNHIEKKHPEINFKREKTFKCGHCSYQTEHKSHFASHVLKKHTPEAPLRCQQCPYMARTEKGLLKHQTRHEATHLCPHCDYVGKTYILLKVHLNYKHSEWLKCDLCEFKTKSKRKLTNHLIKVHEMGFNRCDQCPYKGATGSDLRVHQEKEHSEYPCPHCDFKSKYKSGVSRHCFYKHTSFDEIKWLECDKCPFKAKSETFLKVHVINQHTGAKE
ncbi:zinc finger protein 142 [Tribolium castaneum]|uniref:Zinc finger protein 142-like Protein n=1 Tax=Tribolium castaneum TaxID=7070 RepID=D6WW19_TRICA|nr:PREDICTED: zinc finger protein 142-like [Tribolium castaneum]EFA08201.1 Zinc finger protein 142-like Protein [Tribolium castaneum]|eukprot:XP_015838034.1 PREDICTED: zinc finger protein 142-like [Tribolium castaneum]